MVVVSLGGSSLSTVVSVPAVSGVDAVRSVFRESAHRASGSMSMDWPVWVSTSKSAEAFYASAFSFWAFQLQPETLSVSLRGLWQAGEESPVLCPLGVCLPGRLARQELWKARPMGKPWLYLGRLPLRELYSTTRPVTCLLGGVSFVLRTLGNSSSYPPCGFPPSKKDIGCVRL